MLVAIAAFAFMALIISVNGDDDDETGTGTGTGTGETNFVEEIGTLTEGDDLMSGSSEDDTYFAMDGSDTVSGNDGDDRLFGNGGHDFLSGGEGDDFQRGGTGADILAGGAGDDHLSGDAWGDLLQGGEGDDTLDGGKDNDILIGNAGADSLIGGSGDDDLYGGDLATEVFTEEEFSKAVNDVATGTPPTLFADKFYTREDDGASDTLDGGDGWDWLFVNDGDVATGGADPDTFFLLDGDGEDTALITDFDVTEDVLLYVYEDGTTPPELSLVDNDDGTQTLLADDVAVSVIVSSGLTVDDIGLFNIAVPSA